MNNNIEFLTIENYIENKPFIEKYKSSFEKINLTVQKIILSVVFMLLSISFVFVESLLTERIEPFFKWYIDDSSLILKFLLLVSILLILKNVFIVLRSLRTFRYLQGTNLINKLHLLTVEEVKIKNNYETILDNTYYDSYWNIFNDIVNDLEKIPEGKSVVLMEASSRYSTLKSRLLILDLDKNTH